jgi:sulfonate transport system permease protein
MPKALLAWLVPVAILVVWIVAGRAHWFAPDQLAPPSRVLAELGSLWQRGLLQQDILASTARVFAGFTIALGFAVVLGTLVGLNRTVERTIDPTLQAIRAVPSLAWVPLLLLWLGIGESAKITLIAIGAFFPIYVNLVAGIHGVDRKLVEVARILGLHPLGGARIGLTQAWLFLVAAELLASTRGLGFLLTEGQQISRPDEILVAILLLAIAGKLCESGMLAIERRTTAWTDGLR